MAKNTKIPFTYHFDEMMEYCDFKYIEGTENEREFIWDTKEEHHVWRQKDKEKEIDSRLQSGRYIKAFEPVWKDNYAFTDTLYLDGMSRGRSAANFQFRSKTTNKKYNVFMTDMVDMFNKSNINHGYVSGTWTFQKRGSNYGLKLVV